MLLGELNDQLDTAGIPNDGIVVQTEGNPPTVFVRYKPEATPQQRTDGDTMLAAWAALSPVQRRRTKAEDDFVNDEALLASIIAQLDQAITDTNTSVNLPGTAVAALPVIQLTLNAIIARQNAQLKLMRFVLKRYRPKLGV